MSEQEYTALIAEAAKSGKQPETLLHEIMAKNLHPFTTPKRPMTAREFMELQYWEGEIENLPTNEPLTREDQAELERIGRLFAGGQSMSDIVIEDRGPY